MINLLYFQTNCYKMSESVTVVIFENIYDEFYENKDKEVEIIIDKVCNSLIIRNNELYYCKENFKTKNLTKIYCDEHEFKNNMCKDVIECCICFESINKENEIPLDCGHLFHKNCLLKTDKIICPLCKVSFTNIEKNYIKHKIQTIQITQIQNTQTIQNAEVEGFCVRNVPKKIKLGSLFIFCILLVIFLVKYSIL